MIIEVVYAVLLATMGCLSYLKFSNLINIVTLFSGIMCFFGAISALGYYGMRVPDTNAHLLVWIFVIVVDMIFLCGMKSGRFSRKNVRDLQSTDISKFIHRARLLENAGLLLLAIYVVQALGIWLFSGLNFGAVRMFYYSERSPIEILLLIVFPRGLLTASTFFFVFVSVVKKKYSYMKIPFVNILIIVFINSGRVAVVEALFAILITISTTTDFHSLTGKVKAFLWKTWKLVFLLMAVLLLITIIRGQEIIKNLIVYFSGSFAMLDYILEYPSYYALNDPTYGYLTFSVITEPIVLVLKVLGLTTMKTPGYESNIYIQQFVNIGTNGYEIAFNANTTALYFFLRDFGQLGVLIGAIFLGGLFTYSYNKMTKGNWFWALMTIYLGTALLYCVMTYKFGGQETCIIIMAFYYICGKKRLSLRR